MKSFYNWPSYFSSQAGSSCLAEKSFSQYQLAEVLELELPGGGPGIFGMYAVSLSLIVPYNPIYICIISLHFVNSEMFWQKSL